MGYASKLGRARASARSPSAAGQCDRCGLVYQHSHLRWQFDWAGASLVNKRILVCEKCCDVPQQQLRAISVPADPVPIQNPRVTDYYAAEVDQRQTSGQNTVNPVTNIPVPGGNTRVSVVDTGTFSEILLEDGSGSLALELGGLLIQEDFVVNLVEFTRVTQQTGEPPGGLNQQPGTNPNAPGNSDPGLPYGNTEIPETGPL